MSPGTAIACPAAARRKIHRPLFLADWVTALFIHYAIPAETLRPYVPMELDIFDGAAYVSLVAFTQQRLRPAFGGKIAAALSTPLAGHPFLNLRTYVRHQGEGGIYFLAEWIPNYLATLIGPRLYGLPYRLGDLHYEVDDCSSHGSVKAKDEQKFSAA